MKATLIKGLNEKDIQAMLNSLNFNGFYFPTLFPARFTPTLTWKSLQAEQGIPVVADVVSYDSKAPRKRRNTVERVQGDIPQVAIAREKTESEILEYFQLLRLAQMGSDAAVQKALLDFVYDDVQFCFTGVGARLEWMALTALSSGKLSLTKTNNVGLVTETAIDFQVPTANKGGVTTAWTTGNAATATPIAVIRAKVKAAKQAGRMLKYIFMEQDTFDLMVGCTEVQKAVANWVIQATATQMTPSLDSVNAYMRANNLPEIRIVESYVSVEIDGTRTTVNPWASGCITFAPDMVVGNTFNSILAEDYAETVAMKAKRDYIMVKKWSEEEPLKEITKGMANAFPALSNPSGIYLLNTQGSTWTL